jgi:hypothetical protein
MSIHRGGEGEHTQRISREMVPKMEKKKNGMQYARTKANIKAPKPRKTPNTTEALTGSLDSITRLCHHQPT